MSHNPSYTEEEVQVAREKHEQDIESCSCFYGGGCFFTTIMLNL